jgi:polar amino acid transport system permease protein
MEVFENIVKITHKYSFYFVSGAKGTLLLAAFTVMLGVIIGMVLALMKLSKYLPLRFIASTYIEIIRGTPVMLQVLVLFYALPMIGVKFPELFPSFSRYATGITALAINSGAYVAEIIRAGIQAVDGGQTEAARSIGMKQWTAMRFIIIPQAIRNILPALGNEFIVVVKESSIVSIIGIAELMFNAKTVVSNTYLPFEPLIIAGVIYFVITFSLSKLLGIAERRMSKGAVR